MDSVESVERWIETELKLGLPDEAAWRWVRDQLGPGPVRHQENHFFDTPERAFRAARIGVRLRREGDAITLTLKADPLESHESGAAGAVSRRIELERPLSRSTFEQALIGGFSLETALAGWRREIREAPNADAAFAMLGRVEALTRGGVLRRFGGFANRREILPFSTRDAAGSIEASLELDRTEYPGGRVDFEIEVELGRQSAGRDGTLSRIHHALEDWLVGTGGFEPSVVDSKLARLEALIAADRANP